MTISLFVLQTWPPSTSCVTLHTIWNICKFEYTCRFYMANIKDPNAHRGNRDLGVAHTTSCVENLRLYLQVQWIDSQFVLQRLHTQKDLLYLEALRHRCQQVRVLAHRSARSDLQPSHLVLSWVLPRQNIHKSHRCNARRRRAQVHTRSQY